ncbi:Spore germination protein B3 precursor [Halalkalibacter krulwichiae]|uniref:Spore germination protein B3 n=1 Tax=Halalkalibacter krulwichiae TaxID=199441 RepID=A0A1X9MFP1_9BACI|nr:Ger(x)C family spore germination protein [Halalkalibacter krulwichiae]ARK31350.1 Spore germination protein B3 precursor [Halalkalibacter krulwichiae]
MSKIALLLFLLLIVTGCWDRREINEISLVTGLALEVREDDVFSLTIEVLNASEQDPQMSEGLTPTITYELKGLTMGELLAKMNMGITRDLSFSHARTLVVDEKVGKEGLSKFLQYLEKNGEFRTDFQIIVAKGVKASDIIATTYPIQKVPSMKMYEQFLTIQENWGGYPDTDLSDFIYEITSAGREPVAAAVTIRGDPTKGKNIDDNRELELGAIIEYDGLALFNKDKLVGFLSVEEARNFMWTQDISNTTVTAACGEEGYIAIQVYNSHTKVETNYENGVPSVALNIMIEGDIYDNQCSDGLDEVVTYNKYQKIMEEHLEVKIKKRYRKYKNNLV